MIYLLLIILIILLGTVLCIDKDVFSPSALMCESYLLAVLCAIINIELWQIDLSLNTVKIIFLGVLSFLIPSFFVLHCKTKNIKIISKEKKDNCNRAFYFNKKVYSLFLIVQIITIFLYFYYVMKTVGAIGSGLSISNIMNLFREGTAYGDLESLVPTYVNQLVKISQIIAFSSLYYYFYKKYIVKETNDLKIQNIFSIASYLVLSLLSGGRYKLITFFIAVIVMWSFVTRKTLKNEKVLKRYLKIILSIVLIFILFSQTRGLVGRTNNKDIITYVSSYFGGSIQLLDMFLKDPIPSSSIFGKETFYAFNRTLAKMGLATPYKMHLEFRSSNGVVVGNVYTSLRCFYYDFGIYGVIILEVVLSLFWNSWYKKLKKDNSLNSFNMSLILYCMFVNCLFLSSYRDNFFSSTLSVSTLTIIIYFLIIKKLLIRYYDKEHSSHDGQKQ